MADSQEDTFYFASGDGFCFAVLTLAQGSAPRGGWVLCAPFGEERADAHRFMVEWSRALATSGFHVLRFDYRGCGDSAGNSEDYTLDDYTSDIVAAVNVLERYGGVSCVGLCGLRLGATLAARAASQMSLAVALLLWEPILKGRDYANELLRALMGKMVASTGQAPPICSELRSRLMTRGDIDFAGHRIRREMFESIERIDFRSMTRPMGMSMITHLVERPSRELPQPYLQLREQFGAEQCTLDEAVFTPMPWRPRRRYDVRPAALFGPAIEWVREHSSRVPRGPFDSHTQIARHATLHISAGALSERPVTFNVNGSAVRGVLSLPADFSPSRPVVVLLSIADNCRTADARFNVRLARYIGRSGWAALRFDFLGTGDSEGQLSYECLAEIYLAVQKGLQVSDTRAALGFCRETLGTTRAVVGGICGGAITAALVAADDERVIGIVQLETVLKYDNAQQFGTLARITGNKARRYLSRMVAPCQSVISRHRPGLLTGLYRIRGVFSGAAFVRRNTDSDDIRWFRKQLGSSVNTDLAAALLRCARRGIPMLSVFSGAHDWASCDFERVLPRLRAEYPSRANRIQEHVVGGADHLFSSPEHMTQVFALIDEWLGQFQRL